MFYKTVGGGFVPLMFMPFFRNGDMYIKNFLRFPRGYSYKDYCVFIERKDTTLIIGPEVNLMDCIEKIIPGCG